MYGEIMKSQHGDINDEEDISSYDTKIDEIYSNNFNEDDVFNSHYVVDNIFLENISEVNILNDASPDNL
uniref:ATS domain-containing protein n=1 Tax=Parastrongyloides trichosuri TaxID=131310 RepID=A0A0N4ZT73_PARTI